MHSNPKADEAELALSWAAERRRRGKFAASHVQRQPSLGQIQANRGKSYKIVANRVWAAWSRDCRCAPSNFAEAIYSHLANQRLARSEAVKRSQKMESRALLGEIEDQIRVEA